MPRTKSVFSEELAARAKADIESLDRNRASMKLQAIVSAAKHPLATVADIVGVSPETIWRWAKAYGKEGLAGLYPKCRPPRQSKLDAAQKAAVYSWLDSGKTAEGKDAHWTLERLRHAIEQEFGITLGINTIWVWLRKEGRKTKASRPKRCKADKQAHREFKKKLPD